MATPLSELLHGLRSDDGVRADFLRSPSEFMSAHGWSDLDPADLQEACYILADAAPAADASAWLTAGAAVDPEHDVSAADGLVSAIGAITGDSIVPDADPHDLDAHADADDLDDVGDLDDLDAVDDLDDADDVGADEADEAVDPDGTNGAHPAGDELADDRSVETDSVVDDLDSAGWGDAPGPVLDIEPVDDIGLGGFAEPAGGASDDLGPTEADDTAADEWDDLT